MCHPVERVELTVRTAGPGRDGREERARGDRLRAALRSASLDGADHAVEPDQRDHAIPAHVD